jgi:hypothetical protein
MSDSGPGKMEGLSTKGERARNFLTKNEVFFRTVATTLLAIMALAVATTQVFIAAGQKTIATEQKDIAHEQKDVAIQQKELVELQTRIAEANALPKFILGMTKVVNQITQQPDDNYLSIENNGGEVHDFYWEVGCFIHVEIQPEGEKSYRKVELTIDHYFSAQSYLSPGGTGLLAIRIGHKNNSIITEVERNAQRLGRERTGNSTSVEEHIFVHIRYSDMLDRPHEGYYAVPMVGGGVRIDDADGKEIFSRWDDLEGRLTLETLTAEQLLSLAYQRINN